MPRGENLDCVRKKTRGRPKGSKDRLSRNIRDRVVQVWDSLEKDPTKSLKALAKKDPVWFFNTFGRALIPKEISVDGDVTVRTESTIKAAERMAKILNDLRSK